MTYIKNPRFSSREIQWYKEAYPELQDALLLARDVSDLCSKLEGISGESGGLLEDPDHAFTATIDRIRHSVDALILLVSAGHSVDAAAAHASLIETCHTLVHLLGAPSRPKHWVQWRELASAPWDVRKLVDSSGGQLGWNRERRDAEYQRYTVASAFKHHNPLAAQLFRDSVFGTSKLAKKTLLDAFETVLACLGFYVNAKLEGESRAALRALVESASKRRDALGKTVGSTV